MNTKSIVAVVKKPKIAPKAAKAVVKKPKIAPKAAKAVVKKPKIAPKAAKAVVKKPKIAPKAAKAAKAAKAVVKKPIRGGAGSKAESRIAASIRRIFSASARRIGSTFLRLQRKTPSNAVVAPTNLSPTAIVKGERLYILKRVRPSPSVLLDVIKDTYISYMNKIIEKKFTAYDLLVLIDIIAFNLNTFFEDFLYNHSTIKFKVNMKMKAYADDLLTYQSKFVKLIQDIRYYIHKFGVSYKNKPKRGEEYFDASTIVYNGILDGTQEGIEGYYAKSRLNFFTNRLILDIESLDSLDKFKLKQKIYFGSFASVNDNLLIEFNILMIELNEILQEFFEHIQHMEINEGVSVLDENKLKQNREYIKVVKETAIVNLRIITWFSTYTLKPTIYTL